MSVLMTVLFRGNYANLDKCPTCDESRWKETGGTEKDDPVDSESGKKQKRFPRKILSCFPLIPRLQRLYMRASTSKLVRWHDEELVNDGKMRHSADSVAWKHVNKEYYKDFADDPRNI
jgi:cation transport regulator ChaB